jgi:hypothetical protein
VCFFVACAAAVHLQQLTHALHVRPAQVQAWLAAHPAHTPEGWPDRAVPPPPPVGEEPDMLGASSASSSSFSGGSGDSEEDGSGSVEDNPFYSRYGYDWQPWRVTSSEEAEEEEEDPEEEVLVVEEEEEEEEDSQELSSEALELEVQ